MIYTLYTGFILHSGKQICWGRFRGFHVVIWLLRSASFISCIHETERRVNKIVVQPVTVIKTSWRCLPTRLRRFEASSMTSSGQNEKRYDPRDTTLKFVKRPDDLDPYRKNWLIHALHYITNSAPEAEWVLFVLLFSKAPEEGDLSLRAEMSCGHAVTPESLTAWCRSLLDQVLSAGLSAVSSDPLIKLSFILSCISDH